MRRRRLADARDVVRVVSRPVPALTCVAGSCSAGCGAQGKARGSRSAGEPQVRGRLVWVNNSEPLLMPRNHHILGRVAVRGDRDRPLRCGRRRPGTITGRADTAVPGVQRAPGTSRVSCVRNMETSSGSVPLWRCGRPTVRGAEVPGGTGCPRSEGRRPKGSRKARQQDRLLRRVASYNWPDTGPGARARKRADVWQVSH